MTWNVRNDKERAANADSFVDPWWLALTTNLAPCEQRTRIQEDGDNDLSYIKPVNATSDHHDARKSAFGGFAMPIFERRRKHLSSLPYVTSRVF